MQSIFQSHDINKNRLHLNAPIREDALTIGVSAVYNDGENHIDGTAGGAPPDRVRAKGARVQVRWAPADWMDLQRSVPDINNTGPTTR